MISEIVKRTFWKTVDESDCHPDLKVALRANDDLSKQFITFFSDELSSAQVEGIKRRGRGYKKASLEWLTADFTKLFLKGIEGRADARRESDIKKYLREHANDHIQDMESTLKGKKTGDYQEIEFEYADDRPDSIANEFAEPDEPLENPDRIISIGGSTSGESRTTD